MPIRPVISPDFYAPALLRSAASASVDQVEVGSARAESSGGTQAGMPPPLALAQQLAERGASFEVQGRNWLFQKTWKSADPEKVSQELKKDDPQVRVRLASEQWIPLESAERLGLFHAFHAGSPEQLSDGALGQALAATHAPGAAYLAYLALSQGPTAERESELFKAFEQGKLEAGKLARPELAKSLKGLAEQGYALSTGTPLATYLSSARLAPEAPVEVSHQGLRLRNLQQRELCAPPTRELELLKSQAERMRRLAGKQAEQAWELVRQDGSSRPLSERVELAGLLMGPHLATLYPAVLRNTPEQAPLQPTAEELQALARSVQPEMAVKALELGRKQGYHQDHWREAVADTRDLKLAERALAALEGKDYAARQATFRQLVTVSPAWAVEAAEELGPELALRGGELARLARAGQPALEAWRHCKQENLPFRAVALESSRELLGRAGLDPAGWTAIYASMPPGQGLLALAGELKPWKPTLEGMTKLVALEPESYPEVKALAARFKNADQAVTAWGELLASDRARPDFAERRQTLEQMVEQKGWEKGRAAYAELASPRETSTWAERLERLKLAEQTWPEQSLETYRRLRQANLDDAQLQAFSELSAQLALKKEGDWELSDGRWVNKLYIGASPQNSLELPVISLAHLTGCKLSFTQQHDLRVDKNRALLEASADGQTWSQLASFPGALGGPTAESVDLSAFDGKKLHLRFVVRPEHWDNSGPGEALAISDLKLTGQSLSQTVELLSQKGLASPEGLLDEAARLPALARLAVQAGGARQALELSKLAPDQDWSALGELASRMGASAAGQIWPRLTGADQARELALVAHLSAPRTPLETLLKRTRQLSALQLSEESLDTLRQVASEQPEWHSVGAWDASDQGWSNRLYIGAPTQNELTSPPLSLAHLLSPQLTLSERHDLRVDGNLARIELAEDGPDPRWSTLIELKGTSSERKDLQLDLSRHAGKTVRLRFAVVPKVWNEDGPGVALSVQSLKLKGETAWGPVSTPLGCAGELWDRALEGLSNMPREHREEALQTLGQLSARAKDARQALELWPLLLGRPERLLERAGALSELAGRMGPAAAASAWPLLDEGSGAELSRVRWLEIAARTAPAGASLADLEPVYRNLCSQPLDDRATAALEGVLARRPSWTREGVWETRRDPQRGAVWSNRLFIGAPFKNELTTPPIRLTDLDSARVVFAARHDLRTEKNQAELEISADEGKSWTALARFQGAQRTEWADQEVDLSAYLSKTVQLRLRVAPEHWDESGPGNAFELAGLKVVGRSAASAPQRTVFEETMDASLVARALEAAAGSSESMLALGELSEKLGDSVQALKLWPGLSPELGKPDFPQRQEAMIALASSCGVEQAVEAWPLISSEGPTELAQRSRLFTLASRLAETSGLKASELYLQMAGTDPEALEAAEKLARSQPEWAAVGSWSQQGAAWIDRLFIGAPLEQHLTTPPLPLAGLTDVKVEFSEKHDLRVQDNVAGLEISVDGQSYTSLAQFPGLSADWSQRSVDLSAYSGRTVQLRFAVKPKQWTNDGPGEALGIRDLRLQATREGSEVRLDLLSLQGAAVEMLAAASSEGMRILGQLGPDQAWRVLGSLGQARALGLLEGRDAGECLIRVLQSMIVGESLERAMEAMLQGNGRTLDEQEDSVIVGGVRVSKRR